MLRQWWKRHTDDADEGAATAEFAVVLPCVAAVAILVLCLGRASVVSMNCQDAAAAGARLSRLMIRAANRRRGPRSWRLREVRRRYGSSVGRTSSPSRCNALWCRIRPVCCPLELPARRPATSSVAPKRAGLCAVRCGIVGCGLCMEVCEVWSLRHTTCETCCETLLATI